MNAIKTGVNDYLFDMGYTRNELLTINEKLVDVKVNLDGDTWKRLKDNDILYNITPTVRGCTSGKNRRIRRVLQDRPNNIISGQNGPNEKNITKIQLCSGQSCDTTANLKVAVLNCRSVRNKTEEIVDHVIDHVIDIAALTETWLTDGNQDHKVIEDITPKGYVFKHIPRYGRKGGGVGILLKRSLKLKEHPRFKCRSFENFHATITSGSSSFDIVVIYKLIPTKRSRKDLILMLLPFLKSLENLLTVLSLDLEGCWWLVILTFTGMSQVNLILVD